MQRMVKVAVGIQGHNGIIVNVGGYAVFFLLEGLNVDLRDGT